MSLPTRPEAATPRTVTWTHNPWEVPALIQRISDQGNPERYAKPDRYVEPERYIDPDGDYIEPEGEWWARKEAERRRVEQDERRAESNIKNAVVRGLDFTSSWSPPWPVLCRCVLQWGRSALTRLQAAYEEIDIDRRKLPGIYEIG
jgi:hypothetical protein